MSRVVSALVFCLLVMTSCVSANKPAGQRKPSDEPPSLTVIVKRSKADDSWLVTYRLPEAVKSLDFNRQTSQFRRDYWKVLTDGVSIALLDGKEAFVSDRPFNEVRVSFKSYYEMTPSDYEFHFKYSDGSVMMYTGHLLAGKFDVTSYSFIGEAGNRIVILGQVYKDAVVKWDDAQGQGTYVYFGKIAPLVGKRFTAVVDPGMPRWLRADTFRMLPKLFDLYAAKTGVPLDFKPVVFFNFEPTTGEGGWQQTGGTLPGLVHLSVKGDPKTKVSRNRQLRLLQWIAHEAAHFWNGRMFDHDDDSNWLHEGGADAFKHRALLELKLTTQNEVIEAHNTALNECAEGLQGIALDKAHRERRFKNHYDCGMILALLTERAVRAKAGLDLFGFWKNLFARAAQESKNKRTYSEEMYFKLLDELTGTDEASRRLSRLVHEKSDDWRATLKTELMSAGLSVELTDEPGSAEASQVFGRKAVREVMKADCGGRYGSTVGQGVYMLEGISSCKTFTTPMNVETIEGHDLFLAGHKAYDAAFAKCAGAQSIRLGVVAPVRKTLEVPCSGPIPKRPLQLKLGIKDI